MPAYDKAKRTGALLVSLPTYNEFCDVFIRRKFDKFISIETRMAIINEFRNIARFAEVTEIITDCRDPKDNKFLELAVTAKATCIITGDEDLLVLNPFRGIPILNANDFLTMKF